MLLLSITLGPLPFVNFRFKVISKIMAYRLGIIYSRVIFHNQNDFIRGHQINDFICIAFEAINMLLKKVKSSNIAIKI